jgi:hypothetical protein
MYVGWTKHLSNEEDKNTFINQIKGSRPVLERLRDLVEEQIVDTDRSELSEKQFENPNWPYFQAYKNGFRSAMSILHRLVDLDNQKLEGVNDRRLITARPATAKLPG